MRPHRGHHGYQVDMGRFHDLHRVGSERDRGMCLFQSFLGLGVLVTNKSHFRALVSVEVSNDVRTPIAVTNDTYPDHLYSFGLRFRRGTDNQPYLTVAGPVMRFCRLTPRG